MLKKYIFVFLIATDHQRTRGESEREKKRGMGETSGGTVHVTKRQAGVRKAGGS